MLVRDEALRRFDAMARALIAFRTALAEAWAEAPRARLTQALLAKCGGCEDTHPREEIIARIYTARS